MVLKLYNTLTKTKEVFTPIDPTNLRMYVCGPTVYDYAHIGNARPVIVFDVLFRLLRHLAATGEFDGGKGETAVTYVRNITDVDDKINARAARDYPGVDPLVAIRDLTQKTYEQFEKDVTALGCLPPTVTPRATEHIAEMIGLIERLIAGGFAYAADGHVLFNVPAMPDYGRLARRSLDDMIAGARVDVAPYKRDPMDFVLWKPSSAGEPGWPSPWGVGRPGWHIECSAMAWKHLGETFDIHGGGIDLVFPHHENEVAQTRCAFGHEVMANIWMHNGFLQVEGEKMSKSTGNFITIRELLSGTSVGRQSWTGQVIRLSMLQTHYTQPIDFTERKLADAYAELAQWSNQILAFTDNRFVDFSELGGPTDELIEALEDDLNTPKAVYIIRENAKKAKENNRSAQRMLAQNLYFLGILSSKTVGAYDNRIYGLGSRTLMSKHYENVRRMRTAYVNLDKDLYNELQKLLEIDGVSIEKNEDGYIGMAAAEGREDARIQALVNARLAARRAKDFAESDRIRAELEAMGIALKDGKDPATGEPTTTWEVKR